MHQVADKPESDVCLDIPSWHSPDWRTGSDVVPYDSRAALKKRSLIRTSQSDWNSRQHRTNTTNVRNPRNYHGNKSNSQKPTKLGPALLVLAIVLTVLTPTASAMDEKEQSPEWPPVAESVNSVHTNPLPEGCIGEPHNPDQPPKKWGDKGPGDVSNKAPAVPHMDDQSDKSSATTVIYDADPSRKTPGNHDALQADPRKAKNQPREASGIDNPANVRPTPGQQTADSPQCHGGTRPRSSTLGSLYRDAPEVKQQWPGVRIGISRPGKGSPVHPRADYEPFFKVGQKVEVKEDGIVPDDLNDAQVTQVIRADGDGRNITHKYRYNIRFGDGFAVIFYYDNEHGWMPFHQEWTRRLAACEPAPFYNFRSLLPFMLALLVLLGLLWLYASALSEFSKEDDECHDEHSAWFAEEQDPYFDLA